MTDKQAIRILEGAKFKAAAMAAESPAMGKAAWREIKALEAELSQDRVQQALTLFDEAIRPSIDAEELNRIVAAGPQEGGQP